MKTKDISPRSAAKAAAFAALPVAKVIRPLKAITDACGMRYKGQAPTVHGKHLFQTTAVLAEKGAGGTVQKLALSIVNRK